jgi:ABC-type antimicrobial peptide transport system permease subunit
VALVLGLVSGYLPAYNASRMNIVDGLRHIG